MVRPGHVADNTGYFHYITPAGSRMHARPKPGDRYDIHDPSPSYNRSVWEWDNANTYWLQVHTYSAFIAPPFEYVPVTVTIGLDIPKCDCGSDKLGHPGHSHWCSKINFLQP